MSVFALAAIAAGCTAGGGVGVVEIDTSPVRPAPPSPTERFCTREYAPVCGVNRGDRRTFGNACEADVAGYRVAYGGECRRGGPSGRPGRPDRPPQSDRACTREYAPVCARRGGSVRTFGNACEADSAGYRVVGRGRC